MECVSAVARFCHFLIFKVPMANIAYFHVLYEQWRLGLTYYQRHIRVSRNLQPLGIFSMKRFAVINIGLRMHVMVYPRKNSFDQPIRFITSNITVLQNEVINDVNSNLKDEQKEKVEEV